MAWLSHLISEQNQEILVTEYKKVLNVYGNQEDCEDVRSFPEDSKNCLGKNKGYIVASWGAVAMIISLAYSTRKKTVSHLKSCQRITLQYKVI